MKVSDLIIELSKIPPDTVVIMARDEEGNGFNKVAFLDVSSSCSSDPWAEVGLRELTPELRAQGYSEEDVLENGTDCVILWP